MRTRTIPTSGVVLAPEPAALVSGPELFRGHPVGRRSIAEVDGVPLELRPVVPGDLAGIDRFVAGLSPRSRFLRFHAAVRRLNVAQLAGIVDVDHRERETLVVRDPDRGRIVALGQYVAVGPGVAELGLAVADEWQHRGLGTRLVAALAAAGREEGVRAFTASVMAENRAALALFRRWPGSVSVERHGTEVEVLLHLEPVTVEDPTAVPLG